MNNDLRLHLELLKRKIILKNKLLLVDFLLGYRQDEGYYFMEVFFIKSRQERDEIVRFINRLINIVEMKQTRYLNLIRLKHLLEEENTYLKLLLELIEERITNNKIMNYL